MTSTPAKMDSEHCLVREIAIQAELLALNSALDADGADQAAAALHSLSRDLRQSRPSRPYIVRPARAGWRITQSL